jgi:hypothetical protein
MKIESVEVIPMRKDSMFENVPIQSFECNLTTSYEEWRPLVDQYLNLYKSGDDYSKVEKKPEFDEVCEKFAKLQKAYMTGPTGIFHDSVYIARAVALPSADHLLALSNTGPLYMVYKEYIDDIEAEKTEERFYVDPNTFQPMHGLWYPHKAQYRLRYGKRCEKN